MQLLPELENTAEATIAEFGSTEVRRRHALFVSVSFKGWKPVMPPSAWLKLQAHVVKLFFFLPAA